MPELHENCAKKIVQVRKRSPLFSSVSYDVWLNVVINFRLIPPPAADILAQAELIDQFAWRGYICWGLTTTLSVLPGGWVVVSR